MDNSYQEVYSVIVTTATATASSTPTAIDVIAPSITPPPSLAARHVAWTRVDNPEQLERNFKIAEAELAAIEVRLKTETLNPIARAEMEQYVRLTRQTIEEIRAAQSDIVLEHATAVVNVIVETKAGVPTTFTTEFLKSEETKIPLPIDYPGHPRPCRGPNCRELYSCPTWGCGEPPCMGEECRDHENLYPPIGPLPPRPFPCDGPDCDLLPEDIHCDTCLEEVSIDPPATPCLSMIDCEGPHCLSMDCDLPTQE